MKEESDTAAFLQHLAADEDPRLRRVALLLVETRAELAELRALDRQKATPQDL